jgi:hypothetical protein
MDSRDIELHTAHQMSLNSLLDLSHQSGLVNLSVRLDPLYPWDRLNRWLPLDLPDQSNHCLLLRRLNQSTQEYLEYRLRQM